MLSFSTWRVLSRELTLKLGARKGFEGVIAFDEAHKAKNMKPNSKKRGAKNKPAEDDKGEDAAQSSEMQGTKSAEAVINLQKLLPLARVVYVSATGSILVLSFGRSMLGTDSDLQARASRSTCCTPRSAPRPAEAIAARCLGLTERVLADSASGAVGQGHVVCGPRPVRERHQERRHWGERLHSSRACCPVFAALARRRRMARWVDGRCKVLKTFLTCLNSSVSPSFSRFLPPSSICVLALALLLSPQAMELLAMQMKQNGQYLARTLSFQVPELPDLPSHTK